MKSQVQVEGLDELTQRIGQLSGVLQKKIEHDSVALSKESAHQVILAWNAFASARSGLPGWPELAATLAPMVLPEPWTR